MPTPPLTPRKMHFTLRNIQRRNRLRRIPASIRQRLLTPLNTRTCTHPQPRRIRVENQPQRSQHPHNLLRRMLIHIMQHNRMPRRHRRPRTRHRNHPRQLTTQLPKTHPSTQTDQPIRLRQPPHRTPRHRTNKRHLSNLHRSIQRRNNLAMHLRLLRYPPRRTPQFLPPSRSLHERSSNITTLYPARHKHATQHQLKTPIVRKHTKIWATRHNITHPRIQTKQRPPRQPRHHIIRQQRRIQLRYQRQQLRRQR